MALVLTSVLSLLRLGLGKPSRLDSLSCLVVAQHFDFFSYMIAVQWGGNIFLVCFLPLLLTSINARVRGKQGSVRRTWTLWKL